MMSRFVSRPDMTRLLKMSHPNLTHMKRGRNHWMFLQNPGRRLLPGWLTGRPQSCKLNRSCRCRLNLHIHWLSRRWLSWTWYGSYRFCSSTMTCLESMTKLRRNMCETAKTRERGDMSKHRHSPFVQHAPDHMVLRSVPLIRIPEVRSGPNAMHCIQSGQCCDRFRDRNMPAILMQLKAG